MPELTTTSGEARRSWLRRHAGQLARAVSIALVAACMYFFVRDMTWSRLVDDLAGASVWPLLAAAVLNYVLLLGKAVAWRIMLAPNHRVPTARLMRYTIVAFAASVLAPVRAGELLRVWLLKRRDGVPTADVAAVAIAEKLLDGVTMLLLVAPLPWLLPGLPRWVAMSIAICAGVALAAFVLLSVLIRVYRATERSSWFVRFVAGMHVLESPGRLAGAMAALMVVWVTDWVMIWLVAHAVGISLSVPEGLLILFTLNLAITAPSTPAGVGALEVGVLAATRLIGIADEPAFALGLIYHALQIIPLLVVGLVLEWRLVLGKDDVAQPPTPGAAPATAVQ